MEAYNTKRNRSQLTKTTKTASPDKPADQQLSHDDPSQQQESMKGAGMASPDAQLGQSGEAALIRRIKKRDLHQFLKCPLCTGFFRDAHTINECLDTFCKSCIYKYFYEDQNRERCPKCQATLGGRPLETIISDQTIQKIVDLLYPQFKQKDAEAIKAMYKAFATTNPLPKDGGLIDYGVEEADLGINQEQQQK